MDTLNDKLKQSTDKLVTQGTSFWTNTKDAGGDFVSRTKSAGEQFWSEAVVAGGELLSQTKEAQKELLGSLQEEADAWLGYVRLEATKLTPRRLGAPGATEEAKAPSVRELEKRLLTGLRDSLSELESKVQERIEMLDAVALPPPSRVTKNGAAKKVTRAADETGPAKKATKAADDDGAPLKAPLSGYDELTAREVLTRLPKLDKKKVEALLSYEEETKNRATVVSAMRSRLEA